MSTCIAVIGVFEITSRGSLYTVSPRAALTDRLVAVVKAERSTFHTHALKAKILKVSRAGFKGRAEYGIFSPRSALTANIE
jgi:hypothetical protein